jgi:hypothetical protein
MRIGDAAHDGQARPRRWWPRRIGGGATPEALEHAFALLRRDPGPVSVTEAPPAAVVVDSDVDAAAAGV